MLEYALKPVLSVLGATIIENGIFVHDSEVSLNELGETVIANTISDRLNEGINQLISNSFEGCNLSNY